MNRWSALLFGGLVGAGLALFLAPRSGPETRRQLKRTAEDLQGQAQDRLREGRLRATQLMRSSQERMDELNRQAQVRRDDLIHRAPEKTSELAEHLEREPEPGGS